MILKTYFERFVSNVQPTDDRVSAISDAHTTLRGHLTDDAELLFPIADSFLSGSYARKTAIDPIKDADIILVLEHTHISGDRKEPRPRDVLENFRSAIDLFYDEVNLETQRRSIQVHLAEEDVRMDVVPAIAPSGKDERLWVPDYHQNHWVESWPKAHIDYSRDKNSGSDGQFVRLVKALKWWRAQQLDKRAPKSFLLEVMTAQYLVARDSLPESFEATVKAMHAAYTPLVSQGRLPSIIDPGVGGDLVDSCQWSFAEFSYFTQHLGTLVSVAGRANSASSSKEDTIKEWRSVFGEMYPETLTADEERTIEKALAARQEIDGSPRRLVPMRYGVSVSAGTRPLGQEHVPFAVYPENGYKLTKGRDIRFSAETNVSRPFTVRWRILNHGAEARTEVLWRMPTEYGPDNPAQLQHTVQTAYRGHHTMRCEIVRDGVVLAHRDFRVNIR
jgi:hypothetical protein